MEKQGTLAVEIETATPTSVDVARHTPTALAMPDVGHLMELALGQGEGGVEANG